MTEAEASNVEPRSLAGKVGFAVGFIVVFLTMIGGAIGAVGWLLATFRDSGTVPEDGAVALVVGGIAGGAVPGLFIPLIVIGMVSGTPEHPRMSFRRGMLQIAGITFMSIVPAFGSILPAQAGRLLPSSLVGILALVFVVGSFILLGAVFPWARPGRGKEGALRRGSGNPES